MKRYRVARDQTPRNFAAAVRAMPSTSIIALPEVGFVLLTCRVGFCRLCVVCTR